MDDEPPGEGCEEILSERVEGYTPHNTKISSNGIFLAKISSRGGKGHFRTSSYLTLQLCFYGVSLSILEKNCPDFPKFPTAS